MDRYMLLKKAAYHANDLSEVVDALANARRSVDDIMNSSVYWAVNDIMSADLAKDSTLLYKETEHKLLLECQELAITLDGFVFTDVRFVPASNSIVPFKPHLSSHTDNPIQFNY